MTSGTPVGLVEIGTNSIKYLVAKRDDSGSVLYLVDGNDITGIGRGLERTGSLSLEAMERSLSSIDVFLAKIRPLGSFPVFAVGTMALRKAKNKSAFSRLLKERTGLDLRVLSGEEESAYSLESVRKTLPAGSKGWLFDTGGGSTEYVSFDEESLGSPVSLDLGALTMTERFFETEPISRDAVKAALEWTKGVLARGIPKNHGHEGLLVGTGGNLVAMASVAMGGGKIDGRGLCPLTAEEIAIQTELYRQTPVSERSLIPGVSKGRSGIILAGACIVLASADFMNSKEVLVSTAGLRYGLIESLLS